jgi:adenylate cyclase
VRIQVILTVFVITANLLGIGVAALLVAIAIPAPSIFTDAPWWITWVVGPAYIVAALLVGAYWVTRRTVGVLRWAIEERRPTPEDQRNAFLAPWRLAEMHLVL